MEVVHAPAPCYCGGSGWQLARLVFPLCEGVEAVHVLFVILVEVEHDEVA
jgi:hypothetical protein